MCSSRKILIPPPQKVNGNAKGEGVAKENVLKEKYGAKLEFPEGLGGGGGGIKKPPWWVMGIFWKHTMLRRMV